MRRYPLVPLVAALALSACGSEDVTELDVAELEPTYEYPVRAILERSCVPCHTSDGLRAGGVELDRYESAYNTRVKSTCTAVTPRLVERFAAHLQPVPKDPPQDRGTCADWELFSMPPDAFDKLTPYEQLLLLRWVELGAPER